MQSPPPEHRIIRAKLSREIAFPLGYELLERAFGDLSQWQHCEFWFQARPTYPVNFIGSGVPTQSRVMVTISQRFTAFGSTFRV